MGNSPLWTWLQRANAAIRRAGGVCFQTWRSMRADGRYRYLQIGAVLLIVFLLSLQAVGPGPTQVSVDPAGTSPLSPVSPSPNDAAPTVTAPTRVLRGVRDSYAFSAGQVVTREPTPVPTPALHSPLAAPTPTSAGPQGGVWIYTVQEGDDLVDLAARFGLQRETLIWANDVLMVDPGTLYVGQQLYILPLDGVYYTVRPGDTLSAIAERFQVAVGAIANSPYNATALQGGQLVPGQQLVVPGGSKPFEALSVGGPAEGAEAETSLATGRWVWPVGGYISQGYWNLHRAIDIAGPQGSTVLAADGGTVTYASWNIAGYGNLVVVDHGNGFVTYYAHLYGFYVDVGDQVEQGQPLGALGNTGLSTGPHLHFEIRENGVLRNPIDLLPKG